MPAAAARSTTPASTPAAASSRASRLAQVIRGRQKTARRVFLYGDGGLGKTTLAAGAPRPLFLDVNQGSSGFDVDRYTFDDGGRTKPENFEELLIAVKDIATNAAGTYDTVVVDVLSDVEQLVWAEVVRRDGKAKSIVDGNLGYGRGYEAAVGEWRRLVVMLESVWRAGLHVILIDHVDVKKQKNPAGADYGRSMPKLDPLAAKFLHTWADYTFFVEVDTVLVPDNADERKAKKEYAQSNGKRLLHARPAAEWMAKSRPELPDPIELPRNGGWQRLEAEIAAAQRHRIGELRVSIDQRLAELSSKEVEAARGMLERAGDDDAKLEQLDNWCAERAAKKGA